MAAARGGTAEEWEAAADGLRARGVGPEVLDDVEARTDEAAWIGGLAPLGEDGVDHLVALLRPSAVAAGGALRYPNPIGLPPVA